MNVTSLELLLRVNLGMAVLFKKCFLHCIMRNTESFCHSHMYNSDSTEEETWAQEWGIAMTCSSSQLCIEESELEPRYAHSRAQAFFNPQGCIWCHSP